MVSSLPPKDQTPDGRSPPVPVAVVATVGVGVAAVVIAAVELPMERALAGACLVVAALALLSLLLPSQQWHRLHRFVTVALAVTLAVAGISVWAGADEHSTVAGPSPSTHPSPSISVSVSPSEAVVPTDSPNPTVTPHLPSTAQPPKPGVDQEDQALLSAFRGPGDKAISASISTTMKYRGSSSIEIKFAKDANYYEASFDMAQLFSGKTSGWNGRTFSCRLFVGSLKNTDVPYGGILFKDNEYDNDYGADMAFANLPGDWVEVRAVVGQKGEPNLQGGEAYHDPNFSGAVIKMVIVFFSPSKDGVYPGKSVFLDDCKFG